MPQHLFRSNRSGDLELFDDNNPPGKEWTLVGAISPARAADVNQLLKQQDKLAERERRQHENLLRTRGQLDELAGELDSYIATPQSIMAAAAKARRPMDADPIDAPSQASKAVKLDPDEFMKLWETAQQKRRGEL